MVVGEGCFLMYREGDERLDNRNGRDIPNNLARAMGFWICGFVCQTRCNNIELAQGGQLWNCKIIKNPFYAGNIKTNKQTTSFSATKKTKTDRSHILMGVSVTFAVHLSYKYFPFFTEDK
jgi:hypothetical protein